MPQDNELDAEIKRLMAAGASDDDILFYIQNRDRSDSPPPPARPDGATLGTVAKGLAVAGATAPAVLAGAKRVIKAVTDNPRVSFSIADKFEPLARLAKFSPAAIGVKAVYDWAYGHKPISDVAQDAGKAFVATQVPRVLKQGAKSLAPYADAIGSAPAALYAAGAGVGAAVPFGFLAMLENEVNRDHKIDPKSNTPAGNIMSVFQHMADEPKQGPPSVRGLIVPGNIDLHNRPVVKNADGTVSTIRSISVNIDGREVLIPTVSDSGRIMNRAEAIDQFRKTGRHLGMFDSPAAATAYAQQLHEEQGREYAGTDPLSEELIRRAIAKPAGQ